MGARKALQRTIERETTAGLSCEAQQRREPSMSPIQRPSLMRKGLSAKSDCLSSFERCFKDETHCWASQAEHRKFSSVLFLAKLARRLGARPCSYSLHNSSRHSQRRLWLASGKANRPLFERRSDMTGGHGRFRGAAVLGIVLLSAIAAVVAYNVGVSHGLAQQLAAQGGSAAALSIPLRLVSAVGIWIRVPGPLLRADLVRVCYGAFSGAGGGVMATTQGGRACRPHSRNGIVGRTNGLKENRPADDPGRRG